MEFELVMRQPAKSTYYDMVVSRNAGIKVVMFKYSIYLRMNPATNCGAQSAWIINIRFKGPPVHSCNISTSDVLGISKLLYSSVRSGSTVNLPDMQSMPSWREYNLYSLSRSKNGVNLNLLPRPRRSCKIYICFPIRWIQSKYRHCHGLVEALYVFDRFK